MRRKRPLKGPPGSDARSDQSSSPELLLDELDDEFESELLDEFDELLELELEDEFDELLELEFDDEFEFELLEELELLFEFEFEFELEPPSRPRRSFRSDLRILNCTSSTVSPLAEISAEDGFWGASPACAPRGKRASRVAGRIRLKDGIGLSIH